MNSLALPAREGIGDEGMVEEVVDRTVQCAVDYAVADGCFVDIARLGIGDIIR
jgi:hypothetical protein